MYTYIYVYIYVLSIFPVAKSTPELVYQTNPSSPPTEGVSVNKLLNMSTSSSQCILPQLQTKNVASYATAQCQPLSCPIIGHKHNAVGLGAARTAMGHCRRRRGALDRPNRKGPLPPWVLGPSAESPIKVIDL